VTRQIGITRPGLAPAAGSRLVPIENIAGVTAGTRFDIAGVILGGLVVLFGLAVLQYPNGAILGLVLLVLGVVAIIGAPKQAIEVMNSGGGVMRIPVSLLERSRTVEFANLESEAVARPTTRGGNVAAGSVAPASPGADASDALRLLNRLREQGLFSEPEYKAKRGEILARL
jgi:hypothetical protein